MKEDAIRFMKGDIAAVVNYFEDVLTDEELNNLSKDIERIAVNFAVEKCEEQRELCEQEVAYGGHVNEAKERVLNAPEPEFE